ncbi:MAG: NUDIX hydrolase [Bdellovibrionales bacterium]|nr:NUDIX hydrolase [Bdellovibrionales bacterium]
MMNVEPNRKPEAPRGNLTHSKEFIPKLTELLPPGHQLPLVASSFKDREFSNDNCTFIVRDWTEILAKLTPDNVTSVGALCLSNERVVLVKNRRGWDIPGGHIDTGETILEALVREIREETGSECFFAYPLIVLESRRDCNPTYIPVFMAKIAEPDRAHQRANEISNVTTVSVAEFLDSYHGNPIFASAVAEAYQQVELRLGK